MNAFVDTPTASITISRSGTGTGGVSASSLTCPGGPTTQAMPCGASYPLGTVVTLTAVPDAGSTFTWGGNCTGAGDTCPVSLAGGDRSTFITFTKTTTAVTTNYYHTDMIGSVRAITDQSGATVIRHDYLPFGEDTQPLIGDPMRFGGKELDPESALMNFEARYYRNTWGRFTQVDPVGGSLGDTQSWNRYAYARNNPLRYVDPTGMSYECTLPTSHPCFGVSQDGSGPGGSDAGRGRYVGDAAGVGDSRDLGSVVIYDSNSGLGIPAGWCASGYDGGGIYSPMFLCPDPSSASYQTGVSGNPGQGTVPTPPTDTQKDPEDPCKAKNCGGGEPTPAANEPKLTRGSGLYALWDSWVNGCVGSALAIGATSAAFDAIGLIPEAGGIVRVIGHGAGYRGVVADRLGHSIVDAFGKGTSAARALNSNTSSSGLRSKALTIAGFMPGLGQLAAGASIVNDAFETGMAISQCR